MTYLMYSIDEIQKTEIDGVLFAEDSYFHPVQDINGFWFISDIEVLTAIEKGLDTQYPWLLTIQLETFVPIPKGPW